MNFVLTNLTDNVISLPYGNSLAVKGTLTVSIADEVARGEIRTGKDADIFNAIVALSGEAKISYSVSIYPGAGGALAIAGVSGAVQTTNIGVGDHIMFNFGVSATPDIVVDTTTTYTKNNGADSVGRIKLKAGTTGHLYLVTFSINYVEFSTSPGSIDAYMASAEDGSSILPIGGIHMSVGANEAGLGVLNGIIHISSDTRIEVRIASETALSAIGKIVSFSGGGAWATPFITIQELS